MAENEVIKKHLNELEQKLKCTIPDDYKEFLRKLEKQFLSYPEYEGFSEIEQYKMDYLLEEKPIPAYWFFHPFIEIDNCEMDKFQIVNLYSLNEINSYQLLEAYSSFQSELSVAMYEFDKEKELYYKNYLPIADNGCGDKVCIGVNGQEKGEVFYCCNEDNYKLLLLANNFSEFLNNCCLEK